MTTQRLLLQIKYLLIKVLISMEVQRYRNDSIKVLMQMLDQICLNADIEREFKNQLALIDPKIYFQICQTIFSELSIKLLKIQEYEGLQEGQKLDLLVNLITESIDINMPELSGREIMNFNLSHIYEFLNILLEYSKLYNQRNIQFDRPIIKTEPHQASEQFDEFNQNPYSARPRKERLLPDTQGQNIPVEKQNGGPNNNYLPSNNQPIYQEQKVQELASQKKDSKNLYDRLIRTVIKQKDQSNKAALRDKRKNKNEDLLMAKKQYRQYLKSYSKQKKAESQRKSVKKFKQKEKQAKFKEGQRIKELPLKDFENIDNFFKSFNFKLRDMKDVYVRRMQKQIRQKEKEKSCYQNRLQRDTKKILEQIINTEMACLKNEHQLRKSEIKEAAAALEEEIKLVQGEMKRKSSVRKRELKQLKKMDLQNIENLIRQQNQKILMQMEEGGKLEQLILSAYGKL